MFKKFKKLHHLIFKCPTFWETKPAFCCPGCGKRYRCYWDGNDIAGIGINYCNSCTEKHEEDLKESLKQQPFFLYDILRNFEID